MRVSFGCTVPGPPAAVFEYVTAVGPDGPVDRTLFAQKYGEPVDEAPDGAVVTRIFGPEGDVLLHCAFLFPEWRSMLADRPGWADREDRFQAVTGGTRWTVTIDPKKGGVAGVVQWLYFQSVGKWRVGVPVLSPVVHHFRRLAREARDAPAQEPDDDGDEGGEGQGA